jgi:hypothetical protein
MSRIVSRRATIAVVSLLVCLVALVASALAATPKKGAHFTGRLSTPPISGFHAPVTFKVSASGKLLDNFTFGSFGCFGAGGFKPGVNPYTGRALIDVGTIKVFTGGKFSQTKPASYTVNGQTASFTVTVSGHFSKRTSATGTIRFTEVVGVTPAKCTSATLTFTAKS